MSGSFLCLTVLLGVIALCQVEGGPDSRCKDYNGLSKANGKRCGRPCASNGDCEKGQICCPAGACGLLCRPLPVVDKNCPPVKGKRKRRSAGTYKCFSNADCGDGICCYGPVLPSTYCFQY
uniref:uncharacterized protein LOC120332633 n=1 Tax=Styela clava TaxID=7725 RepID=UPI00193AD378|nr:uncharacterized protein LOC120332633 [Styela clava]